MLSPLHLGAEFEAHAAPSHAGNAPRAQGTIRRVFNLMESKNRLGAALLGRRPQITSPAADAVFSLLIRART